MSFSLLINKFTAGELDPRFLGEVDYEGYRKGARKLRNALCTPQGAGIRRFGTTHYTTILDEAGAFVTDITKCRILGFNSPENQTYWIIIRPDGTGGVVADVIPPSDDEIAQTVTLGSYLDTDILDIRWLRDVNRIFFFHRNYVPVTLALSSAGTWSANSVVFSIYPGEDYASLDNSSSNYTNDGTTFTPNAAGATTVTATNPVFTSNHAGISPNAGGFIVGNGGVFRIVSVNAGGTVATGYTVVDFTDTTAIPGSDVGLFERAWGDGSVQGVAPAGAFRGYPQHGAFFQGRLVLGGHPALPGRCYFSETKDFLSFNNAETDASKAFASEAGEMGSDLIQDIIATKSLVLITAQGTSATSILTDGPITPTNVFMNTQGREGARNMDAVLVNNQILYADNAGNTIWSMIYEVPDSGYNIINASILSSHLIRNPMWADVYDPSAVDGRYYLAINEDGTMAMLNSILEENIKAWTLATTTGSFIDVACMNSDAAVLVRRKIITGAIIEGEAQDIYTIDDESDVYARITDFTDGGGYDVFVHNNDYLLIGSEIPFTAITFTLDSFANYNMSFTYEYLNDDGVWEEFNVISDGTNGFQQSGNITWGELYSWVAQIFEPAAEIYDDEQVLYWMRIRRNTGATIVETPLLVDTKINTVDRIYFEKLDFSQHMDATTVTSSSNDGVIYNLGHLAGQLVFIFQENYPLGTYFVSNDGTVDIGSPNVDVVVGLDYKPYIIPMPVTAITKTGYLVYEPQQIKNAYIDFYKSAGLTVNGQRFPQPSPQDLMGVSSISPRSGYELVPLYSGWNPRAEIVISQSYPAPMTIRGISFNVEIG